MADFIYGIFHLIPGVSPRRRSSFGNLLVFAGRVTLLAAFFVLCSLIFALLANLSLLH